MEIADSTKLVTTRQVIDGQEVRERTKRLLAGPSVPYRYFDDGTGKPFQPSPAQETVQHPPNDLSPGYSGHLLTMIGVRPNALRLAFECHQASSGSHSRRVHPGDVNARTAPPRRPRPVRPLYSARIRFARTRIAVLSPVDAAPSVCVIDLPTQGENAESNGNAPLVDAHRHTRTGTDRRQRVPDTFSADDAAVSSSSRRGSNVVQRKTFTPQNPDVSTD